MYSHELVDAVLKSADIVSVISSYIPVTKKGRSYVALCPFHDDKNPSLQISPEKRIYKCFSCGEGGNAISFVSRYEKIPFEAAVRKVAELIGFHDPRLESERSRFRVDPSKEPLFAAIAELKDYYRYSLASSEGEAARAYLKQRGLDEESIKRFEIGYAPKDGATTIKYLQAKGHGLRAIASIGVTREANAGFDMNAGRLIFPLSNPEGRVIGFSARRLDENDGGPKYVNSPETAIFEKGKSLYNYHRAFESARREGHCYLLEGFMDVIALSRIGIHSAVALMGTGLSSDQIALLRRVGGEIRLALDGDRPGLEGMMKASRDLARHSIPCRVIDYAGDTRDPDDVYLEDGPEALKEKMGRLFSPFEFRLSFYMNQEKGLGEDERKKVLLSFLPYLHSLPPGLSREDAIVKLAKATSFEIETVRGALRSYAERTARQEGPSIERPSTGRRKLPPPKTRLQKAEREALYYMMKDRSAIKVYLENIDTFYDRLLNEIANYVVAYVEKRGSDIELDLLVADIEAGPSPDKVLLEEEASLIYETSSFPPYSEDRMLECASVIAEERSSLIKRRKAKKEMEGKSPEEKARLLRLRAEERAKELGFNKKKD